MTTIVAATRTHRKNLISSKPNQTVPLQQRKTMDSTNLTRSTVEAESISKVSISSVDNEPPKKYKTGPLTTAVTTARVTANSIPKLHSMRISFNTILKLICCGALKGLAN
eukprot:CAMPEP_0174705576 /NCGR_PEP_ID=MMETSP1094-20130205/8758_1 /TAXON_ID=156173 /ORGANISM="Chrysochromulina brevifilum, Strain UTEX LB 985" /LENGTH=109 /DNA_ID=CAMNT_0015903767 /DNA_START=410 /DNA_END=736 /DNA_ORIENTATION=-